MPPPPLRHCQTGRPRESQQFMPKTPPYAARDGLSIMKPQSNIESQLMPPPKVIPCDPGVTSRHVGDLVSPVSQAKHKEEIGKIRATTASL